MSEQWEDSKKFTSKDTRTLVFLIGFSHDDSSGSVHTPISDIAANQAMIHPSQAVCSFGMDIQCKTLRTAPENLELYLHHRKSWENSENHRNRLELKRAFMWTQPKFFLKFPCLRKFATRQVDFGPLILLIYRLLLSMDNRSLRAFELETACPWHRILTIRVSSKCC